MKPELDAQLCGRYPKMFVERNAVCEECGAVTEVGQTKGWIRTLCWKCVQDQRAHEKDKRQREILASWKANAFAKPVWLEMKEKECRKRKTP